MWISTKAADKPRPEVDPEDVPEFLDNICTQHSVTFTEQDTIRQKQALPYQSKEWDNFHTSGHPSGFSVVDTLAWIRRHDCVRVVSHLLVVPCIPGALTLSGSIEPERVCGVRVTLIGVDGVQGQTRNG